MDSGIVELCFTEKRQQDWGALSHSGARTKSAGLQPLAKSSQPCVKGRQHVDNNWCRLKTHW
eukprot:3772314-Lingulodinium_polyedra.AAC.1